MSLTGIDLPTDIKNIKETKYIPAYHLPALQKQKVQAASCHLHLSIYENQTVLDTE